MLIKNIFYTIILITYLNANHTPLGAFSISRIHYGGGGDWYSDKSSIPNLLKFVSKNTSIITTSNEEIVQIGDDTFYKSYYFYLTGHGNIKLTDEEGIILRDHLINGAFLHADDIYSIFSWIIIVYI